MANPNIWNCEDERNELWSSDPRRAAFLTYLEVVAHWHQQVEEGTCQGVPAMHRLPSSPECSSDSFDLCTQRSRPVRYTRDSSAGQWTVPNEVRERWLDAA